jgi:integrase-like protein
MFRKRKRFAKETSHHARLDAPTQSASAGTRRRPSLARYLGGDQPGHGDRLGAREPTPSDDAVRHGVDTPKSTAGQRTIALGKRLADELYDHLGRTPFKAADERVFVNPRTDRPFGDDRYKAIFTLAMTRAGIEGVVRPSHDLRHSSITNAAAAGTKPEALMSRAGHSSCSTTRRYIDLAGEQFREEADRLEERLWGRSGTKSRYQETPSLPDQETEEVASPLG